MICTFCDHDLLTCLDKPASTKDIASKLGCHPLTAKRRLRRLEKKGSVVQEKKFRALVWRKSDNNK